MTSTSASTTDESTGTGTSTSTTSTSTGSTTGNGNVDYPVTSCLQLREFLIANEEPQESGIYSIQTPQDLEPIEVYCDLETAGGGWLLVGRSTPLGAPGSFGWRAQTGSVLDDEAPYSLDLQAHPFAFSEILVGTYQEGKIWGANVYRLGLPGDFVAAHGNVGLEPTYFEAVEGMCQPPDGPTMFTYAGYTDKVETFWFRDKNANNADFGLNSDRFNTFYDNCPDGGEVDTKQGMIMVR